MAKSSGLGDQLLIGGHNIGADVAAIGSLSTPRETLPATGITQFAMARMYGKRDGQAEFTCFFNPEEDGTHEHLATLPRTDTQLMYLRGDTVGGAALAMNCKQIDYAGSRGDDGSFTFAVSSQANAYGADWGWGSGLRADTDETDGAAIDLGTGSLSFGWQAYLQVYEFTGTDITISIEESQQDDGDPDTFATITGAEFTEITTGDNHFERLESSSATATVERYVRVVSTGTFDTCSFAVVFVRNSALRVI